MTRFQPSLVPALTFGLGLLAVAAEAAPRPLAVAQREVEAHLDRYARGGATNRTLASGAKVSIGKPFEWRAGYSVVPVTHVQKGIERRFELALTDGKISRSITIQRHAHGGKTIHAPGPINRRMWGTVLLHHARKLAEGGAPVVLGTTQPRGGDGRYQRAENRGFFEVGEPVDSMGPQPAARPATTNAARLPSYAENRAKLR